MNKFKRLMAEFEAAEGMADELDALLEDHPEDEKLEAEWMKAYTEEKRKFTVLAAWLEEATNGQIDERTARAMVYGKREELKALIAMI